ncbi:MAG TPA: TetR family transcriptional regulator, partial [Ktedonobacterales bacterium]|nr:TetR family transcriptional regulator [Ktedonobacterales bacterium]
KSLEATKISEIVARAGVAQGTFYLYFPSKTSLVIALAEEMNADTMAALQEAIAQANSLADAIARGVRASFQVMDRYRDVLGLIHSRDVLTDMKEECIEMDKPFHGFVSAMIRQGQETGEVSASVNSDLAAQLIVGLIEHAGEACYVRQAHTLTEDYISEVARFIQSALGIS